MRLVAPISISRTRCGFAFGTADDVTAAVNTAAQLIGAGEHAAALATLAKCDKEDARVMNAMGYAYALGGDVARASEWWDKAATKGSEDARHNLEELKKSLE